MGALSWIAFVILVVVVAALVVLFVVHLT